MSAAIVLRPGSASLADWRAIYRGAEFMLDPVARADVEASAATLSAILDDAGPQRIAENGNGAHAVEPADKDAGHHSAPLVRLFAALKLASLAQGVAGVGWEIVEALEERISRDLLPAVPSNSTTDRQALACLCGTLTGSGEMMAGDRRLPADQALREAGLALFTFNAHEKRALCSGSQLSTAAALAGLFEAERALQSAIVVSALSANGHEPTFHPRAHELHRHAGQIEVASALRDLRGAVISMPAAEKKENGAAAESRAGPLRLGACLDLLRQAGETLEIAANAPSEGHLVLWQSEAMLAGIEDASSAAVAADMVAMALREIGELAKRRVALVAARVEPEAPDDNGHGPRGMATTIVGEIRRRSYPTGLEASGTRRLLPMAGNVMRILAIEVLLAARLEPTRSEGPNSPSESVRRLLRQFIPSSAASHGIAPEELVVATDLVSSGALASASGVALPSVATPRRKELRTA